MRLINTTCSLKSEEKEGKEMSHLAGLTRRGRVPFGTAQWLPARKDQILNAAGGYTFEVDPWTRLDRFLILGTEGGTFYAGERELTRENAKFLADLLQANRGDAGLEVVARIVRISNEGRAVKNDTAIFALAMAASIGNLETRRLALASLNKVCRTGSHLLMFAKYVEQFRGWGRGLKNAVANWYLDKTPDDLAYQVTKYANRNGYTQRDLLRLSHPKTEQPFTNAVFQAVVKGKIDRDNAPALFGIIERLKDPNVPLAQKLALITSHRIAREVLPTEMLQKPEVWEALLENMPMTAMVRNLATMTRLGLLTEKSAATQKVVGELTNVDRIRYSRIHPMSILIAAKTYTAGRGLRGSNTWIPSNSIVRGLDEAFYLAYGNVEPTNKRLLLSLDLSGSMAGGYYSGYVMGIPGFTPREATAALALVQVNIEPNVEVMGFSAGERNNRPLQIAKDQSLERVVQYLNTLPSGGTDLSMPVVYATRSNKEYDGILIYTDNETWAGRTHPFEELRDYRNRRGLSTKLATVSVTATANRIADPQDALSMDFVGFDTSTPSALSEFLKD
jgi:60 kDa SS-A/Ro ribonucleoprotein